MTSVLFLAFIALTALETVYAVSCPSCTDPYNPDSCTGSVACHNVHDICELRVHSDDRNRLEYLCFNSHACTNHEAHTCVSGISEYCSYCCKDADACKAQRDQLFSTVFTTTATKAPATTMPPATTAPSALTTDAGNTAQTTDDMTTVPMTNTTS